MPPISRSQQTKAAVRAMRSISRRWTAALRTKRSSPSSEPTGTFGPQRPSAEHGGCRVATSKAAVRSGRGAAGIEVALAPILAVPVDPAAPPDRTFEPNCRLRSLRDFQLHPLNWERSPKAAIRGEHGGLRRRRVSMEMRTLATPQPMRRYDPKRTLPSVG